MTFELPELLCGTKQSYKLAMWSPMYPTCYLVLTTMESFCGLRLDDNSFVPFKI